MRFSPEIVFYVSGHGFGHASRASELIRALQRAAPHTNLEVRTSAPAWLFPAGVPVVQRTVDVGVVQRDSFRVEPRTTLERYAEFVRGEPELIRAEVSALRAMCARAVVADVPSVAFAIGQQAGIPSVGVANFCWDWIYEPFVRAAAAYAPLLDHLRGQHGLATTLLRLPFAGDLSCFRRVEDIPLYARRRMRDRVEVRRRLDLPIDAVLVLLSFGGFSFQGLDTRRLSRLRDYVFVIAADRDGADEASNLRFVPRAGYAYQDLLAACDAVVAKLGYGIVADCLANRVPIAYTPRGRFREEPLLGRELERLGRAVRVPRTALHRWDLAPYLDRLLGMTKPWADVRLDGADVAASKILALARV